MRKPKSVSTKLLRVVVGRYTYETDLDLKIGDRVLLPTVEWLARVQGPTWEGVVTALESDYDGPCKRIIAKIA